MLKKGFSLIAGLLVCVLVLAGCQNSTPTNATTSQNTTTQTVAQEMNIAEHDENEFKIRASQLANIINNKQINKNYIIYDIGTGHASDGNENKPEGSYIFEVDILTGKQVEKGTTPRASLGVFENGKTRNVEHVLINCKDIKDNEAMEIMQYYMDACIKSVVPETAVNNIREQLYSGVQEHIAKGGTKIDENTYYTYGKYVYDGIKFTLSSTIKDENMNYYFSMSIDE